MRPAFAGHASARTGAPTDRTAEPRKRTVPHAPSHAIDDSPSAWRGRARDGRHASHTVGRAAGFLQGNLAIVPDALSRDFLLYCHRNPKPCPLIGVGDPGEPALPALGDDIDIRTDVPAYRVFRDGEGGGGTRVTDLSEVWRDDLVAFVLGCSFSFEDALVASGIPVRHVEAGRNVPMYRTTIATRPAGPFAGPLVVTLRAFRPADAIRAIVLSERFRLAHGAPLHLGDPRAIGIDDLDTPDFGDPPIVENGDVLVFWACGVTPQLALRDAGADLVATHEPGCMLITDIPTAAAEARLSGMPDAGGAP